MKKKESKHFFSMERAKVLSYIKDKPSTISVLAKKLGMSRAKVYYYIQELEDRGLVQGEIDKKKGKRVPRIYHISETADPIKKSWFDLFDRLFKAENELNK